MVTIVPPQNIAWNDVNAPVPCISGDAGRCTSERPFSTIAVATAPAPSERSGIVPPRSG